MSLPDYYITRTYVIALGLIALLSLVSHITLEQVIAAHEGSAAVINASGRQRMLSQRIAFDAALYVMHGDAEARGDLIKTIDQMDQGHRRLLGGGPSGQAAPSLTPELRALYFKSPVMVDALVNRYLGYARVIASAPPSSPAALSAFDGLARLARQSIVPALDAVVSEHQRESENQLADLRKIQMLVLGVLLITLALEALLVFRPMAKRIQRYAGELLRMAMVDPLTGALNRRALIDRGKAEIERARRYQRPLSLLMLDGDHFKQVNDIHGHAAGDEALRTLASRVTGLLRASDSFGRMGGEEFVVLAPETPFEGVCDLAERIRSTMAAAPIRHGGAHFPLTVSIGVTSIDAEETDIAPALARADTALYRAKQAGRNRVSALPHGAAEQPA